MAGGGGEGGGGGGQAEGAGAGGRGRGTGKSVEEALCTHGFMVYEVLTKLLCTCHSSSRPSC